MRWCTFRSPLSLKDLPHPSHTYGRSSECMLTWSFSVHLWWNALLHTSHTNICLPLRMPSCLSKFFWCLKVSLPIPDGPGRSTSRSFKVCSSCSHFILGNDITIGISSSWQSISLSTSRLTLMTSQPSIHVTLVSLLERCRTGRETVQLKFSLRAGNTSSALCRIIVGIFVASDFKPFLSHIMSSWLLRKWL